MHAHTFVFTSCLSPFWPVTTTSWKRLYISLYIYLSQKINLPVFTTSCEPSWGTVSEPTSCHEGCRNHDLGFGTHAMQLHIAGPELVQIDMLSWLMNNITSQYTQTWLLNGRIIQWFFPVLAFFGCIFTHKDLHQATMGDLSIQSPIALLLRVGYFTIPTISKFVGARAPTYHH